MVARLGEQSDRYLRAVEIAVYAALGALLSATIALALGGAATLLWKGAGDWTSAATKGFPILDRLLLVLMMVEVLHTVRISFLSHHLLTEPFLIVGLIASIRRILVITLEAADMTKQEKWNAGGEGVFRAAMLELGLLGVFILILVVSIVLLRRSESQQPQITLDR